MHGGVLRHEINSSEPAIRQRFYNSPSGHSTSQRSGRPGPLCQPQECCEMLKTFEEEGLHHKEVSDQ